MRAITMTKPNDLFKQIFNRKKQSVWVAVLGKKQSGKTDFCLHIMERLNKLGLMDAFGSNVSVTAPFEVDFIEDFQTLKQRCQMLNPDPKKHGIKRYFYFASEMGKWLPKDQSWKNVDFIEELQTVRKYGLSWIGDAISRVDSRALNETHFQGCFKKLSQTNPTIAIYEDWVTGKTIFLKNIPRTNIEFDTWYSANFYMESQIQGTLYVPYLEEHEIVKKYRESGSWAKIGVHRQEGKRCLLKVLDYHYSECLPKIAQEKQESESIKAEIA